ncbi:DNA-directed RNA polymerase subunit delta [Weissella tructae]|uniref:Probable DNA-directed RNA polymerase subunit delta n=2 Tax=Weissella TaxID=46255 RepID=A0A075TU03_9LACO|nr:MULTISPECIES: DNA-directed RNA polymerase subunit delta [Weissella]AIG64999.1 putative DNA-directed RNA polymerase subunit delta [Weissella tructae]AIM62311.1 putative DNA-directed RNA polymerase subunit delta [Weissella ceti]AIM63650.2 putative DNA-directed RNA polymerase subunit delta [Weissella ceti]ELA07809.1 DNA-directed RNA polymerase sigma subunit RpoE [Weissella ceti NC36]QVV91410.1 DNA-directed RNA polymerase subunit delta [Weissella tructae]
MAITQFEGQNKSELSMIEVARAILSDRHETMAFSDLLNEVQSFTGKTDDEIRARLAQFYTDLNIDGSFISLGDNVWGLRSWYPIDSIDEAVHLDLEEEEATAKPKKKRKKINAFLADVADDDDVIDYNDDDPEDDDFGAVETSKNEDEDAEAADDDSDDDSDDDFDEVAGGIGEEIGGIAPVDDDYGSGDIEK